MIINHNSCIKLVRLVIFIYDARSHIYQIYNIIGLITNTEIISKRGNRNFYWCA